MIVVVAGVAGSGKTTVGQLLAGRLHCEFADGDAFHPPANVEKMHAGIPLTDDDRWPWLRAIVAWMDARAAAGESAVVACSALRRAYREVLLSAAAARADGLPGRPARRRRGPAGPPRGPLLPAASSWTASSPPWNCREPPEPVPLVPARGTPEQTADAVLRALGVTPAP